jgi:hypothetical protein
MSFLRHARSIGPMWGNSLRANWGASVPPVGAESWLQGREGIAPLLIVRDESHRLFLGGLLSSRARLRFAGWVHFAMKEYGPSRDFQRTANSGLTGCLSLGVHPTTRGLKRRWSMSKSLRLRSISSMRKLWRSTLDPYPGQHRETLPLRSTGTSVGAAVPESD